MDSYIVDLLTRLIETPSVNPLFAGPKSGPGGESGIIALLEAHLVELGVETWIVEPAQAGRPSLVGLWRGTGGGRSLMLNGHVDTVGVEDYENPFTARREGDRLYGRGSYDMKGGVVACLATMARLARERQRLAGDVWISLVADEEAASLGAQAVAERFPTHGVVVTEPTHLQPIVAHKGFVWVRIETKGFACHGSDHRRGVDANRRMAGVLRAIDRLEEERSGLRHELLGPASLHLGTIEGGLGPSLYSPHCSAVLELRTLPSEKPLELLRRLRELIAEEWSHGEESLPSLELVLERPSLETDPEGPLCRALTMLLEQDDTLDPKPAGVAYWTDAGIFRPTCDEVLLFGPSGHGAHETAEWVDVPSVERTCEILLDLARSYCGGQVTSDP